MPEPKGRIELVTGLLALTWAGLAVCSPRATLAQAQQYTLDPNRQWSSPGQPEPGSDAALLAEARRHLAEDQPAEARRIANQWINANERSISPLVPAFRLVRGDAMTAMGDEFEALYDYEAIATRFRESEEFPYAVERELDIALRYAGGLNQKILGMRIGDPEDVLTELLIRVQERMPKSQLAERAAIALADFYYDRRKLPMARDAYDLYLRNFPAGPNRVKAEQRRIQADIARFKGPRYNSAPLINARVQLNEFVKRYPAEADASGMNEAMIARLDESAGASLLEVANWYLKVGDEPSARVALRRLLRDHPRTVAGERAETMLRERGWLQEAPPPAPQQPPVEAQPASEARPEGARP